MMCSSIAIDPTNSAIPWWRGFEEAIYAFSPKYDVKSEQDNDTHIFSLQGPLALEHLPPHTPMDLANLAYFTHQRTTLFNAPSIARGGYSAERGYEVFSQSATPMKCGMHPCSRQGQRRNSRVVDRLDTVRVEAGLLFFPYEMPHGDTTPWEVKADWTIDLYKPNFSGKGRRARKSRARSFISGLEVMTSSDEPACQSHL